MGAVRIAGIWKAEEMRDELGTGGQMSGELHVVVGAGPIGAGVAEVLAEKGHRVRVITRSGSGPAVAGIERVAARGTGLGAAGGGIERVAADAADQARMAELVEGAVALYNCANPAYHRWPALWPPIAASLLSAAETTGAVLVTVSNLYGYGPASRSGGRAGYDADHPMTEQTPLAATGRKGQVRAQMWRDARSAHEAGRLRAVEIRASDYVGPGASAVLGERVVPRVLSGRPVTMIGRADRPHTWSFTRDVVQLAVVAGSEPQAWGRVWHVPSNEPRTQRQAVDDLASAAGVTPVPVRTLPAAALYGLGLVSPLMRELRETAYQFSEDFVMDSTAAQAVLGLEPTPWDRVIAAVLESFGPSPRP